ncbi:hypothetical protein OR1_01567 [Geobacter sp. OR-1]|uniref:hypothetical protein n=1 Tax=Geobacter sp. OR-1 TaxID=1266765 RepID=UPI0005444FE5|nr:hypothetical protein [Geobacter sp. OR-1]GAM09292.1 hypothetical protein OR1_01567 [Geobacter sp. OR-1]
MKRIAFAILALLLFGTPAFAGLDDFLSNLNIQARTDLNGFSARVSAQFGVPELQVRTVINTVKEPADAFMVFQLGKMTRQPPETVERVYQANRGKGWGVIAKELGIKPGSREFHALKRGDFELSGAPASSGKSHGKGKGKGHNK